MENSGTLLAYFQIRPIHVNRVRLAQRNDQLCLKLIEEVANGTRHDHKVRKDGTLMFGNRLNVLKDEELKKIS